MAVPEFRGYYPSEEDMGNEQLCFYKALEEALNQGKHLDVQGNIGYVFVYLYKLLGNWNKAGFEDLYQYLIYVSELYTAEKKLSDYCKFWAYDCLLGLNRFDDYL